MSVTEDCRQRQHPQYMEHVVIDGCCPGGLTRFGDAGGDGVRTERAKCNGQQAQEAGDDWIYIFLISLPIILFDKVYTKEGLTILS